MKALWRGFDKKMLIFVPRSQFLAGSSHAAAIFSNRTYLGTTDHLFCAFWTAGFTARPPNIGSVRCTIIFQVSNRTITSRCILNRSARLYGDCMEPGRDMNPTIYVLTPLQF